MIVLTLIPICFVFSGVSAYALYLGTNLPDFCVLCVFSMREG